MASANNRNWNDNSEIPLTHFFKVELLAMGPHMKYLNFKGTEHWDIQDINDILEVSLNLINLDISFSKIQHLPPLPFCICLTCSDCPLLSSLPELPRCRILYCDDCPLLSSLPELPNCEDLNCGDCSSLLALPELPNCINLSCDDCPSLFALSEFPNCEDFSCRDCPLLSVLPDLPKCKKLDCRSCALLAALPERIPDSVQLDCSGSPLLEKFFINFYFLHRQGKPEVPKEPLESKDP